MKEDIFAHKRHRLLTFSCDGRFGPRTANPELSLDDAFALLSDYLGWEELELDQTEVVENGEWWYLPIGWIGCWGFVVNKRTRRIATLGSGYGSLPDALRLYAAGEIEDFEVPRRPSPPPEAGAAVPEFSLVEFARTGRFGKVEPRVERDVVLAELGEPEYWQAGSPWTEAGSWSYGSIHVMFNPLATVYCVGLYYDYMDESYQPPRRFALADAPWPESPSWTTFQAWLDRHRLLDGSKEISWGIDGKPYELRLRSGVDVNFGGQRVGSIRRAAPDLKASGANRRS